VTTPFRNQAIGGTLLKRKAIQSPNYVPGVSGWTVNKDGTAEFSGLVLRGTFNGTNFVIGSSGAFFYGGTPAAGNLICAIATAAGTDSFGNAYGIGLTILDRNAEPGRYLQIIDSVINFTSNAANTKITTPGQIFISDATAAGDQPALRINTPATSAGNSANILMLGESQDATAASYMEFTAALIELTGIAKFDLGMQTAGGLAQNVTGRQAANVAGATISTTGNHTIGQAVTVPAADFTAGAQFEWNAEGTFGTGTTPSSAIFTVFVGSTNIGQVNIPTITAGLSAAGWHVRARMTVETTGASATTQLLLEAGWHTAAGPVGSAYWFTTTSTNPVDLSTARNLSLQFAWGSVPAGTSLTWNQIAFGRSA
jgi:hypothetical protein